MSEAPPPGEVGASLIYDNDNEQVDLHLTDSVRQGATGLNDSQVPHACTESCAGRLGKFYLSFDTFRPSRARKSLGPI